tara:strand:+ start:2472 stop:3179 length:708 start_codon:yes stop_codon:yes gene_type:complete
MKKNQINEDEIFEINSDYSVHVQKLGNKETIVLTVDDFYKHPMAVRQLALDIPASYNKRIRGNNPAWRINAFYVLDSMSWIFDQLCRQYYHDIMSHWSPNMMMESFQRATFMVNVMQSENLPPVAPHMDNPSGLNFASTIYLNTENESNGGTSFYEFAGNESIDDPDLYNYYDKQKTTPITKYITESIGDWKMTGMVPMKFNRMVLYPQNMLHTAYVKQGMFYDNLYRLNQQFFI